MVVPPVEIASFSIKKKVIKITIKVIIIQYLKYFNLKYLKCFVSSPSVVVVVDCA